MNRPLQIGISGFTSPDQVDRVIREVGEIPDGVQLRLGVSCNYHGLMKMHDPRERPNLFLSREELGRAFLEACRGTSRVAHYSSRYKGASPLFSLRDQISRLMDHSGGQIDGVQLNDVDLKPGDLRLIKQTFPDLELTVPITGTMQRKIANAPRLNERFLDLFRWADYLLLDASAGSGKGLDVHLTSACLEQLDKWELTAGRMLAGGLGPGLGELLGPLAAKHRFGVDAEGRLRRDDVLQPDLAAAYVRDAIELLSAM